MIAEPPTVDHAEAPGERVRIFDHGVQDAASEREPRVHIRGLAGVHEVRAEESIEERAGRELGRVLRVGAVVRERPQGRALASHDRLADAVLDRAEERARGDVVGDHLIDRGRREGRGVARPHGILRDHRAPREDADRSRVVTALVAGADAHPADDRHVVSDVCQWSERGGEGVVRARAGWRPLRGSNAIAPVEDAEALGQHAALSERAASVVEHGVEHGQGERDGRAAGDSTEEGSALQCCALHCGAPAVRKPSLMSSSASSARTRPSSSKSRASR